MRKIKEEQYGLTFGRAALIIGYVLITVVFIFLILISTDIIIQGLLAGILAVLWVIYAWKLRTSEMINNSTLFCKYMYKKIKRKTIIAKYDAKIDVSFMEGIIPLRKVHQNGLIEFIDNRFGVLLTIQTPRISDDELQIHISKVTDIMNSLHGDIMMKIFVFSRSSSFRPLENVLIKCMKDPNKSDKQIKHLYELNKHICNSNRVPIDWQTYVLIGLGVHNTVEEAEIARLAHIPGLTSRFNKAGIHVIQIMEVNEIVMAYRQAITQISL